MGRIKKEKTTRRGQWHKTRSIKVTLILDSSLTRADSNIIRKLGIENKLYKARIPFEIRNTNPEDFRNTIWNHFSSIRGQPFSLWKMNKNNPDLILLTSSIRTSQDVCASEELNRSHLYIKPLDLSCEGQMISSSSSSIEPENLSSQGRTVQQSSNYYQNRDEPNCSSSLAPLSNPNIEANPEYSDSFNTTGENSSNSDIDDGPMGRMNIAPNVPKNEPYIDAIAKTGLVNSTIHFTFPDTASHIGSGACILSAGTSEGHFYKSDDQLAMPLTTINLFNDIVPIGNELLPADPLSYEGLSYASNSSTPWTGQDNTTRNATRLEQQGHNDVNISQQMDASSRHILDTSRPISNHQAAADGCVQSDSVYPWKCLLCCKVLQDAVTLPCCDSFCWSCIKLKINNEEDLLNCPTCTKGYHKTLLTDPLQHPYVRFTRKAVKLHRIENTEEDDKICEACEPTNAVPALSFCMDCNSKYCQSCLRGHDLAMKRFTGPNGHTVVALGSASGCQISSIQTKYEEKCQVHPYNNVELLCNTCEKLCCYACVGETCLDHDMTAPESFKKDLNMIHKSIKSRSDNINELLIKFNKFNNGMERTSDKIIKIAEEFIDKITEWKLQMLQNLKEIADKQDLTSHGLHINAVRRFNDKLSKYLESIRLYGSLKDIVEFKGTIANINNDIDDTYRRLQLIPVIKRILFSPRLDKSISMESKIDESLLRGSFTLAIKSDETRIKKLRKRYCGVAVMEKEIFVLRVGQPIVEVYDSQKLTTLRHINIPGMSSYSIGCLAGCVYNKALYISDVWSYCIHRVDLTNNSIISWNLRKNHEAHALSVTAEHTLLVTVRIESSYCSEGKSRVVEYTSEGQQLRDILFEESIKHALHTMQLSSEQFIVSHGCFGPLHRVCVINSEGQIIKSYGGEAGGGESQLNWPCSLAVDYNRKHIFVADTINNRVVMLDTNLTYLGQVHTGSDLQRSAYHPCHLLIDSSTDRLFVSDGDARLFIISLRQKTDDITTV